MAQLSNEQLVELITREVMRLTGADSSPVKPPADAPKALLVGSAGNLPDNVASRYNFVKVESAMSAEDTAKYECLYIAELSLIELSDIALGRDNGANQSAVIGALFQGLPVYLCTSGLPHRKYKQSAKGGFYQMVEGYVRTLQGFGIELVGAVSPAQKYISGAAADLPEGIITESVALNLIKNSETDVIIARKGTVVTPSARDAFLHAGKTLELV